MTTALCDVSPPLIPLGLAEGIELIGEYQGTGRVDASHLARLANGRMLEVSSLLHMVAVELGQGHGLTEIAAGVSARAGRSISPESVAYLIDQKLRPLGIVTSASVPAPARVPVAAPVLGLALHARVLPSRLVRAITVVLRPLFLPPVVLAILTALAVVEACLWFGPGFGPDLSELLQQPALLLTVVGLTLVAGVIHEMGHATASRYGGAEPGVIGAGIYLIWPVFYNDLNDSYRLSRAGRLRADLGGVYFNAIFILVLAGGYGLTGFTPLLAAIVVQHLAVLQQFVPFLRLDGYYIVSDIAGVPDLFGRIRPILSNLVPGRPPSKAVTELKPTARAIVTGWVLLSVPLLGVCLILLITGLPRLIGATWTSTNVQAGLLGSALRAGAPGAVLLSGLQLLILSVPFLGLGVALRRALLRSWRAALPRLGVRSPARHAQSSPAGTTVVRRLLVILVLLQAVILQSVSLHPPV